MLNVSSTMMNLGSRRIVPMKKLLACTALSCVAVAALGCADEDTRTIQDDDTTPSVDEPGPPAEPSRSGDNLVNVRRSFDLGRVDTTPSYDSCQQVDFGPVISGGTGYLEVGSERIGEPEWHPFDFHLFKAAMGTEANGYKELYTTIGDLLPEHALDPVHGIAFSRKPHMASFESELTQALLENGIESNGLYHEEDWTAPDGLFIAFNLLPTKCAPRGVTADLEESFLLADEMLPLRTEVDLYRDGDLVEEGLAWEIPKSAALLPAEVESDGYSHMPVIIPLNTDVIEGRPGDYQAVVTVYNSDLIGWKVRYWFTVK
jgi:hypothetical protein